LREGARTGGLPDDEIFVAETRPELPAEALAARV
jgi:hypothetical protein